MESSGELLVLPPILPEEEQKPEITDDSQDTPMEIVDEPVNQHGLIKVTNISPGASKDQMKTLFGFLGKIADLALYPMDENVPVASKICYVKYEDKTSCDVAQHLTNTVFIDRPLVIIPISEDEIPDEGTALQTKEQNNGFMNGDFQDPFSSDPFAQFLGNFDMGSNLPPPPVLGNIDPVKIEEIRRTIFVSNLDDSVSPEMLVAFFSGVGEIKYVRQLQEEDGTKKRALIEFTDLSAVTTALQYTGVIFCDKPLKVNYSKCAIIKPDFEKLEAERKQADRISRYSSRRRSSSLTRRRSRSRSTSWSRERKSSRSRRSRSGSYSRSRRARSRSRSRKRRSRSRSFSKSSRRRSKSRSMSRRRRKSRSRSRDRRRRRSYSRSRSRDSKYRNSSSRHHANNRSRRRSKSRSVSRSGSVEKKSRSKSPAKDEEKTKKAKSRSRSRSTSKSLSRRKSKKERRSRSRSLSRNRDRSRSRDRKAREKDRKQDRKDRERSSSKTKKAESPKKRAASPQYKDGHDTANKNEVNIDEDDLNSSKKKSKTRSYDSAEDSPPRSKKKSRSGRREDSD